ncbi:MAG: hypothetical protein ACLQOO_30640 [Terriglobia bacterium]
MRIASAPTKFERTIRALYGDLWTRAGQRITGLFDSFAENEDPAVAEKACAELPKWIAQERRDVQREQELYQREVTLRTWRPNRPEKELQAREAALDRQITEQARLLLQLKSKRSLWAPQPEAGEAAGPAVAPGTGPVSNSVAGSATPEPARPTGSEGEESSASGTVIAKKPQNAEAKPIGSLESVA